MAEIKVEALVDFQTVHMDMVGDIYEYQGKIIRVINRRFTKHSRKLLEKGGLIEKLVKNKLFVDTWVSDLQCPDADIILQHKKVEPQQHYSQWSFEMMKDAALLVLKINEICSQYGYELKDCHQGNIMFDGIRPVWVDFGSFVKKQKKERWIIQKEFIKCYYLPLLLWSKGYDGVVNSLFNSSLSVDLEELISINYHIPRKFCDKVVKIIETYLELEKLSNNIKPLCMKSKTLWGDYQDGYWERNNARFDYEINWINQHCKDINSMVEIGANQGMFSYLVAQRTNVKKIIATDCDQVAIDIMYKKLKSERIEKILPGILDFVWSPCEILRNYQSDLVVANALTHHLLLSQGMTMKAMLEKFSILTSKFIIVEFMPKGVNKAHLPKWYTKDWFLQSLREKFEIVEVNENWAGRIIIIGKKKK